MPTDYRRNCHAEVDQKLLRDLDNLRQRFKMQGRYRDGRAPTVCSDDALYEIALLRPKKLSDFAGVRGIGQTFIENYGEQFLKIILRHESSPAAKGIAINPSAGATLKELEKKLVSINRRNRLLYMPKAPSKYAYDLFPNRPSYDPLKIILGGGSDEIICNINDSSDIRGQSGADKYRRVVQLIREINKDIRDKGQNDLFIGYPYVQGRLTGEDFDVRAPLALFPVKAERESQVIRVMLDDSRDIMFNNTLVLAHFKFNNIMSPLPVNVLEDISKDTFIQSVITFYKENGLIISDDKAPLGRFIEYNSSEFPHYHSGELHLVRNIVLGKFPTYSSSIQKDFDEILVNNEINTLLDDLITQADDVDYYSDSFSGEEELNSKDTPLDISEHSLVYINSLNSSQEAVLTAANKIDELVVQGPPGTGKSQTITSLITEFVNDGKTVLMVSEKKTALDVVYSRLGRLSRYALLIDDVGNKDLFYQQLGRMVNLGNPYSGEIKIDSVSEGIDSLVKRLEHIAQKLYEPDSFGIEPYKLYRMSTRVNLDDSSELQSYKTLISCLPKEVNAVSYSDLEGMHRTFSNSTMLDNLSRYISLRDSAPWLEQMKENLSDYDIIVLDERLQTLIEEITDWKSRNVFRRLFTKGKLKKGLKAVLQEYSSECSKNVVKSLFDNLPAVKESLKNYGDFSACKLTYSVLSEVERCYFGAVRPLHTKTGCGLLEGNDIVFNHIICEHIQQFESANRDLLQQVQNFDDIIRALGQAIDEKQQLSRSRLEHILAASMGNITASKRKGDILRVIDSRHKWSVNKFVSKFDFELFKGVKIWLLTPEVVSEIIPLQIGLFDLVIFDEASQMYVEKGIPSILRAKKVVIAGDHKQLRPSNLGAGRVEIDEDLLEEDEEIPAALEEESLLDLARFRYNDILLNFHYRSKYEELIAFSNYAFYKGRLFVSPNVRKSSAPPIEVHKVEDALWVNRSNMQEAREIVRLLREFFVTRTNDDTIGIITFKSSQRDLIEDLIDEECAKDPGFSTVVKAEIVRKSNGEDIGLFIKNIESVQGDERDVIMFSIGYAKNENGRLVRNYGWLNQKGGENRLNVAISRARKKVHLVVSFAPHELQVEDARNEGPRILKKHLEYAFAVSSGDAEAARQVLLSFGDAEDNGENISFDSDFENQVFDALVELGYEVETQVGIGGYNIDLAVKFRGKYILGIECDGRLYHSSKSARERDYHRQKYLESRGWRIHRIWSPNGWKNQKAEIQKICRLVDSLKAWSDTAADPAS